MASRSVLGRALLVLAAFGPDAQELTLAELCSTTGLPKTTVHRISTTLVSWGALEHAGNRFRIGMRIFELGELVAYRQLRELVLPYMGDLYEATHQVVQLAVLDGDDVVYIEKITGHELVPSLTRVGGRVAAHRTAVGKALLAFSPRHRVDRLIQRLTRSAGGAELDCEGLRSEIELVARRRLAFDFGDVVPGVTCVATPLFGRARWAVAALSLMGAGDIDIDRAARAVSATGQRVSDALGAANWS